MAPSADTVSADSGPGFPGSSCQTVFFDDPVGPLTSPGLLLDPSYPVYTDDTLFRYTQVLNVSKRK